MKREWLKGLDLSEEQIDQIMAENGKDIENAKGDLDSVKNTLTATSAELDTVKAQLETANSTIESYKSMDVEAIKRSADDYKTKYEEAQRTAQEQIDSLKFEHSLESALSKAGAKNVKAVKALLDIESLRNSKNTDSDIESQISSLKESDPYLFPEEDDGAPIITTPGTGGRQGTKNPFSKEFFNLTEQGRLFKEDPKRAKALQEQAKK